MTVIFTNPASFLQEMPDPTGVRRLVFPRLLTIIADMKEKWELFCLYGSPRTNRPCPVCTDTKSTMSGKMAQIVLGSDFSDSPCVTFTCILGCVPSTHTSALHVIYYLPFFYRYRSKDEQLRLVSSIPNDSKLASLWSTHPIASGLNCLPGVVDVHEKVVENVRMTKLVWILLFLLHSCCAPLAEPAWAIALQQLGLYFDDSGGYSILCFWNWKAPRFCRTSCWCTHAADSTVCAWFAWLGAWIGYKNSLTKTQLPSTGTRAFSYLSIRTNMWWITRSCKL